MAAIPYHVVHSFLEGKKDTAGNFRSDGFNLWSYHQRLATFDASGAIIVRNRKDVYGSVTTARHYNAVTFVLNSYPHTPVAYALPGYRF